MRNQAVDYMRGLGWEVSRRIGYPEIYVTPPGFIWESQTISPQQFDRLAELSGFKPAGDMEVTGER